MRVCEAEIERVLVHDFLGEAEMQPMGVGSRVPPDRFEQFSAILPDSLLYVWRRFGFQGFSEGRFWLTDPVSWKPVVDAWLAGLSDVLPFRDEWWCMTRTALGNMELWGERSGAGLSIDASLGMIFLIDNRSRMARPSEVDRMGRSFFTVPASDVPEPGEEHHERDVLLLREAIARLGVLGPHQMYAFDPPRAVSDHQSRDVRVVSAIPHLTRLARVSDRAVVDLLDGDAEQLLVPASNPELLGELFTQP